MTNDPKTVIGEVFCYRCNGVHVKEGRAVESTSLVRAQGEALPIWKANGFHFTSENGVEQELDIAPRGLHAREAIKEFKAMGEWSKQSRDDEDKSLQPMVDGFCSKCKTLVWCRHVAFAARFWPEAGTPSSIGAAMSTTIC